MYKYLLASLALLGLNACTPIKPSGEFSDIRGQVFSSYYNGPLQNALVSIPRYAKQVRTDADGYFELRGLPTKWTDIEVIHPTHGTLTREVKIEPYGTKHVHLRMSNPAETKNKQDIIFERNFDIWTTDMYGQNQKNLTGSQSRQIYRTYPVWSGDKSQIGYIGFQGSQRVTLDDDGVWMMRADGTMPRKLTSVMDVGRLYHLDWVPGAERFVFMLQDRTFVYDHKLGSLKGLSGNLNRPSALEKYDAGPVWTPNGQNIVTSAYNVDFETNFRFSPNLRHIYIMDANGGKRRQLTQEGDNYAPGVSHDGRKIAYVSTLSGQPEIWTMDIDGKNPQQLTYMKAEKVGQPRWSADDKHILFTSDHLQTYKSLQPKELWMIDVLTGKTHMVTNDAIRADG